MDDRYRFDCHSYGDVRAAVALVAEDGAEPTSPVTIVAPNGTEDTHDLKWWQGFVLSSDVKILKQARWA